MYDDIQPSYMTEAFPKARKQHKCCECGRIIEPGEHYQRISGVWDGRPGRFKTCTECWGVAARFRHYVEYNIDRIPAFGELFEVMKIEGVTKETLPCIPRP